MIDKRALVREIDTMKFRVLIVAMVMLFPGCLEDLQEEISEQVDIGTVPDVGYTKIRRNIFTGESQGSP